MGVSGTVQCTGERRQSEGERGRESVQERGEREERDRVEREGGGSGGERVYRREERESDGGETERECT